jgi:hypothetical protein
MLFRSRLLSAGALLAVLGLALSGPLAPAAAAAGSGNPILQAPGIPYLGLTVENTANFTDSGTAIVVDGRAAGRLVLDAVTSGPAGTAVTWDIPADLVGESAAPTNGGLSLVLDFGPAAAPLLVTAHLLDAGGVPLASVSRSISFDPAPPNLFSLSFAPLTSAAGTVTEALTWLDQDAAGSRILSRSVVVDRALPLVTGGCPNWTAFRLYTPDSPPDQSPGQVSPPGYLPPLEAPHTLSQVLPDLPTGACYRVRVYAYDERGLIVTATSALFAPGLVYKNGLPIAPYSGQFDLYRPGSFASQQTYQWCIPASAQMMLNLLLGSSAPSGPAVQSNLLAVAQTHDGLDAAVFPGTNATGWVAALARYSSARYETRTLSSFAAAVSLVARRMAQTGRPAGIIVWGGKHAWVVTGFESATNPATDAKARITALRVSGPLWPRPLENALYDPAPDTRLSVAALSARFTSAFGVGWIVVVPVVGH